MGDREIPDELIDQLLGEYEGPEQLTGPDGLINQLRRRLIERAAGAELEQHLGYRPGGEPGEGQANRRNGVSSKTLRTVDGPVTVELPRDRDASFDPRIVPKHARSFDGFDEQILALYAGGMTTREIQRHVRELYGVDVSEGLISEVTASIQDDVRAWQSRPLEEIPAPARGRNRLLRHGANLGLRGHHRDCVRRLPGRHSDLVPVKDGRLYTTRYRTEPRIVVADDAAVPARLLIRSSRSLSTSVAKTAGACYSPARSATSRAKTSV